MSQEGFEIREYDTADLPRLQAITVATFGEVSIDNNMERLFGAFGEGDWRSRKAAAVAEDCRIQPDGVFVAVNSQGEAIGYITTRRNQTSRIGWIPNLAVDPAYQGKGIGRALIGYALERLKEAGMEMAKIETLEQNPIGRNLYPQFGFEEVARQIHYAVRLTDGEAFE